MNSISVLCGEFDLAPYLISCTLTSACCGSANEPTMGGSPSASISMRLYDPSVPLEGQSVRLLINQSHGFVPMGVFTLNTPESRDGIISITGSDAMLSAFYGTIYHSSLPSPTTALDVLREIAQQSQLSLVAEDLPDAAIPVPPVGSTIRAVLADMAGVLGCNVWFTYAGDLKVGFFTPSQITVTPNDYYEGQFNHKQEPFILTQLENRLADGTVLTAGIPGCTIAQANPHLTQAQLDLLHQRSTGLSFYPGDVALIGGTEIQPGQIITVTDPKGVSYPMAVCQVVHQFDGGWKTTVHSFGSTASDLAPQFTGPVTSALRRISADIAEIKELNAQKITADRIDVSSLLANGIWTNSIGGDGGFSLYRQEGTTIHIAGVERLDVMCDPFLEYYDIVLGSAGDRLKFYVTEEYGDGYASGRMVDFNDFYHAVGATAIKRNAEAVTLPNNTTTTALTLTLSAGVWMVTAHASFPANANGFRQIRIGNSAGEFVKCAPSPSGSTCLNQCLVLTLTEQTDVPLALLQNSGGAMTIGRNTCVMSAVRMK